MMPLLAQTTMEIPMPDTMKTLIGLIGIMTLGITVLTFVTLVKKVFGRTPPLEAEFKKIRSELYEVSNRTKKEVAKDISALSGRADSIEGEIEDIKLDRERKWQEIRNEYHQLDNKLAMMSGRLEFIIRKLDRDSGIE
jgi:chorismate synthase